MSQSTRSASAQAIIMSPSAAASVRSWLRSRIERKPLWWSLGSGMAKSKKQDDQDDEAAIIEKMDEALKRMMNTPPETHKEMVERRRGQNKPKHGAPPRKAS